MIHKESTPGNSQDLLGPLVSVIVITFNSSKYVIEGLESIKAQTYQNIELIITDDCSTDSTVEICRNWISLYRQRFVNTKLLTIKENTGIPANLNRGWRHSSGQWIKLIAGDDLLTSDCIEKNVKFCVANNFDVIFSKKLHFTGEFRDAAFFEERVHSIFKDNNLTSSDQYQLVLRGVGSPPNTMFYNRTVFERVDGFDESFKLIEDWPMNMRLTKAGFKIGFMDEVTFYYRIHNDSVFQKNLKNQVYRKFEIETIHQVYKKYVRENIRWDEKLIYCYKYSIMTIFYKTILNKPSLINKGINFLLMFPVRLHKIYSVKRINKLITSKAISA